MPSDLSQQGTPRKINSAIATITQTPTTPRSHPFSPNEASPGPEQEEDNRTELIDTLAELYDREEVVRADATKLDEDMVRLRWQRKLVTEEQQAIKSSEAELFEGFTAIDMFVLGQEVERARARKRKRSPSP